MRGRRRGLLYPVLCSATSVLWKRNALFAGIVFLPFGRPGGDLLSHVLGRSTIGAEGFHGRVRDGIGCLPLAIATRPWRDQGVGDRISGIGDQKRL